MTSYMCYVFEFLLENDKFLVYVSQKSIFTIALFNRQKSFQKPMQFKSRVRFSNYPKKNFMFSKKIEKRRLFIKL